MRTKILTVDDSKTVRMIVRKVFKPYDCEILEAGDGAEGLTVAAGSPPDLILLDVTMPVMDGVEMLTKLKADPRLKGIPVLMLTAEGGRDHVLKIAKIGIRDYIIKPFKDEVLIEKAKRIIELKPLAVSAPKAHSSLDPLEILVVEDKPAIVQLIEDGLKHTSWKIHGVGTLSAATEFCSGVKPDLVLVSLLLPDEAAFNLFRALRAGAETKQTPILGLIVRTETAARETALKMGFTDIVTKPIDMAALEARMAKLMNLDMSSRYFEAQKDVLVIKVPEIRGSAVLAEAGNYMKGKLAESVDNGIGKAIVDLQHVKSLEMELLQFLVHTRQACVDLGLLIAFVGNAGIITECKGFEDTRAWSFYESMDDAKSGLSKATQDSRQVAAV
ncbi:MAG: response regulator [Opitutaceae bacterium]|jgi:two-component system cell cycle response regulator